MKKSKIKWLLYGPLWILIIGAFTGLIVVQLAEYESYRIELDRLTAELIYEQQVAQDLRHRQAFYESDAYIEQLAREMLGFVRQDEIVFQNIAE